MNERQRLGAMGLGAMGVIEKLSQYLNGITGAGPGFAYVTAPTPATERVVLCDGLKYTYDEAVKRLAEMLVDASEGRAPGYYCREARCSFAASAHQFAMLERDAHEHECHPRLDVVDDLRRPRGGRGGYRGSTAAADVAPPAKIPSGSMPTDLDR